MYKALQSYPHKPMYIFIL